MTDLLLHPFSKRAIANKNLTVPSTFFTSTQRRFRYLAPQLCNLLPNCIKNFSEYENVCKKIKEMDSLQLHSDYRKGWFIGKIINNKFKKYITKKKNK